MALKVGPSELAMNAGVASDRILGITEYPDACVFGNPAGRVCSLSCVAVDLMTFRSPFPVFQSHPQVGI